MATGLRLVFGACLAMLATAGLTALVMGQPGGQTPANRFTGKGAAQPEQPPPQAGDQPPRSPLLRALYDSLDKLEERDTEFGDRDELRRSLRDADVTLERMRRENARALASVNRQAPMPSQPNVVLITIDDLPLQHLGCYGQTAIQTPTLDRLAARGARFTQFRLGPGNVSARWALLTGQSVAVGEPLALQPGVLTVPQALWKAGYTTAWIGDCWLPPVDKPLSPTDLGFEYWYGSQDRAVSFYPSQLLRRGQAVDVAENSSDKRGRHINELYSEHASQWIRQLNRGRALRPFFLMVSFRATSANWQAPAVEAYDQQNWSPSAKAWASLVTSMDRGVATVLAALRDSNKLTNTVVVVTSSQPRESVAGDEVFAVDPSTLDNSEAARAGVRLPLIVYGPGRVTAALIAEEPATIIDLAPTLAGLANFSRGRINYAGQSLDDQLHPLPPTPVTPQVTESPAKSPEAKPPRKLPQIIRGRP